MGAEEGADEAYLRQELEELYLHRPGKGRLLTVCRRQQPGLASSCNHPRDRNTASLWQPFTAVSNFVFLQKQRNLKKLM